MSAAPETADLWVDAEIAWDEREVRRAELERVVSARELALAFMRAALGRLVAADEVMAKAVEESIARLDEFERAEVVAIQALAIEAREKSR